MPDVLPSTCSGSVSDTCQDEQDYLSDLSPSDKPWDTHKAQAVKVADALASGHELHQRQAQRMRECSKVLEHGWVIESTETGVCRLKLKSAQFCRVRHCPICQWRRALMWVARFYHAFPKIYADHPKLRYVMLTLTVRNCRVSDLRQTIGDMNKGWQRLTQRKLWPAVGFVRSLEITRGKDGLAHPHFHCLLAVEPGYFTGRKYLSTAKWARAWADVLRVDYTPICDVRIVKPRDVSDLRGTTKWPTPEIEDYQLGLDAMRLGVVDEADAVGVPFGPLDQERHFQPTKADMLLSAITEVIKYAVKPDDMLADPEWLRSMADQLRRVRAVAVGGIFRDYLSDDEPENLVTEESDGANNGGVFFGWRERVERYQRLSHAKCAK